jgi:hypothetical protein
LLEKYSLSRTLPQICGTYNYGISHSGSSYTNKDLLMTLTYMYFLFFLQTGKPVRFNFEGLIAYDDVSMHEGLHHHGEEPEVNF